MYSYVLWVWLCNTQRKIKMLIFLNVCACYSQTHMNLVTPLHVKMAASVSTQLTTPTLHACAKPVSAVNGAKCTENTLQRMIMDVSYIFFIIVYRHYSLGGSMFLTESPPPSYNLVTSRGKEVEPVVPTQIYNIVLLNFHKWVF